APQSYWPGVERGRRIQKPRPCLPSFASEQGEMTRPAAIRRKSLFFKRRDRTLRPPQANARCEVPDHPVHDRSGIMNRITLLTTLVATSATPAAEPFRQTLASTSQNLNVPNWEATNREVTPRCPTPWFIRKLTLHGGKQEGVDVIVVDNGKLRFTVIPTRGMGILAVTIVDFRLGWDSPVKEVVHPQFINLQARGGLGWLDGFNEWLCRCGLESNGSPGPDKFINNVGDEATMELTLHGKIANLPAQEVEVV